MKVRNRETCRGRIPASFGVRWQSGAATPLLLAHGSVFGGQLFVRAKAAWRCASRRSPRHRGCVEPLPCSMTKPQRWIVCAVEKATPMVHHFELRTLNFELPCLRRHAWMGRLPLFFRGHAFVADIDHGRFAIIRQEVKRGLGVDEVPLPRLDVFPQRRNGLVRIGEFLRVHVEMVDLAYLTGIAAKVADLARFTARRDQQPNGQQRKNQRAHRIWAQNTPRAKGLSSLNRFGMCFKSTIQRTTSQAIGRQLPPHPGPLPWREGDAYYCFSICSERTERMQPLVFQKKGGRFPLSLGRAGAKGKADKIQSAGSDIPLHIQTATPPFFECPGSRARPTPGLNFGGFSIQWQM